MNLRDNTFVNSAGNKQENEKPFKKSEKISHISEIIINSVTRGKYFISQVNVLCLCRCGHTNKKNNFTEQKWS